MLDLILNEMGVGVDDTKLILTEPLSEGPSSLPISRVYAVVQKRYGSDNVDFYPYTLERELIQMYAPSKSKTTSNEKIVTFKVTRLANPNDEGGKYRITPNMGTHPFFPPPLLLKYEKNEPITTLVITEGYKKAWRGCMAGIMTVGLSSITHIGYKDDDNNTKLYPDIVKLVRTCNVANIVILWDGDCRDISQKDLNNLEDISKRPYRFYDQASKLHSLIVSELGCAVYFASVNSDVSAARPKGLDDLLNTEDDNNKIASQILDPNRGGEAFHIINLAFGIKKLKEFFHLLNVDSLYKAHATEIKDSFFAYKNNIYTYDSDADYCKPIAVQGIPEDQIKTFIKYQFYHVNNRYYVCSLLHGKWQKPINISNFILTPQHLIIEDFNATRNFTISGADGTTKDIILVNNQFTDLAAFCLAIESSGQYLFKGTRNDLMNIKEYLYVHTKTARAISRMGLFQGKFVFGNYIKKENMVPIPPNRIIEIDSEQFYVKHSQDIIYNPNSTISFRNWAQKYVAAYQDQAWVSVLWATAAFHFDIVRSATFGKFPMLYFFGPKGTGKTYAAESLLFLLGITDVNIAKFSLSSITDKALPRVLCFLNGGYILLDEFKNSIHPKIFEILKGIFDGTGGTKAEKTMGNEIRRSPATNTAIICGQEMPTAEAALPSRCITVGFFNANKEATKDAFHELKHIERHGITSVTLEILECREQMELNFERNLNGAEQELRKLTRNVHDDRLYTTHAILLAVYDSIKMFHPLVIRSVVVNCIIKAIATTSSASEESNESTIFFQHIFDLYAMNTIHEGTHIMIKDSTLYFRLSICYNEVAILYKSINNKPFIPKQSISKYIRELDGLKEVPTCQFYNTTTRAWSVPLDTLNKLGVGTFTKKSL